MNRAAHEIRNWEIRDDGVRPHRHSNCTVCQQPARTTASLSALNKNGISYPAQAGRTLLSAGHTVCQQLSKGVSYQEVTADIAKGFGG
jgi:hypothetical protein